MSAEEPTVEELERLARALDEMIDAAMSVSDKWVYIESTAVVEGEDRGYPKYLPDFDEFIHDLIIFREDVRYDIRKGDCRNCFRGTINPHHTEALHTPEIDQFGVRRWCNAPNCDCRGYTPGDGEGR